MCAWLIVLSRLSNISINQIARKAFTASTQRIEKSDVDTALMCERKYSNYNKLTLFLLCATGHVRCKRCIRKIDIELELEQESKKHGRSDGTTSGVQFNRWVEESGLEVSLGNFG